MDPVTIGAVLGSAKVAKAIHDLAVDEAKSIGKETAGTGFKSLLHRLQPDAREKAAKHAIKLFAEEWFKELEDRSRFDAAIPGYLKQLEALIGTATAEIAVWMDPEIRTVDLRRVETTWAELKLDDLPEGFDWKLVAQNYARAIRDYIKRDPELRAAYQTALQERSTEAAERTAEAAERFAGPAPGFDIPAYRKFLLEKKCNSLQLATMHFSTYADDRRVTLWSVFVPQSARESAPVLEFPPELLRGSGDVGPDALAELEIQDADLLQRYRSSPVKPVLELLHAGQNQSRHLVITGDPGAGKSALLKYLALKWAENGDTPLPILIDLKEYAKKQDGFLKYCQSGLTFPHLDASELSKRLKAATASLYLDGLDEIFDRSHRSSVIEEIATISAEYPDATIIVTSRKVGYQPERLTGAGFVHLTLEDFDQQQILAFLERWHEIAEDDTEKRKQLSGRLARAIADSASIRELAGNPLLLTMMAILNRSQELPRNRVTLYRKASEVLLHEWDANRALQTEESFDLEDKEFLLRELAGDMQEERVGLAGNRIHRSRLVKRFSASLEHMNITDSHEKALALVQQLQERNFILASAGGGYFSFVHRTFLEYFCAAWFVYRLQTVRELTLEYLRDEVFGKHWKDGKWHEVLRLIAGMVAPQDAGVFIEFLMNQDGTKDNLQNMVLAASCLNEVREPLKITEL